MRWKTTPETWGGLTILIHWLTALTVFGMFGLGLWMADLNLYHPWYHKAPELHKSVGILLFLLTCARLLWRLVEGKPRPLASHSHKLQMLAQTVHALLYLLLFSVMVFGYLISTADGRAVDVFNWFSVPATLQGREQQEDIAGVVHLWLAVTLISLVVLHALAAIKHHVFDKDRTLRRMLGL